MAELECFFSSGHFREWKIIEVLAFEMTVGGTAYFSVNSLSKPLSLPNIAIATLRNPTLLSTPATPFLFLLSINLPTFCVERILSGVRASSFLGHFLVQMWVLITKLVLEIERRKQRLELG